MNTTITEILKNNLVNKQILLDGEWCHIVDVKLAGDATGFNGSWVTYWQIILHPNNPTMLYSVNIYTDSFFEVREPVCNDCGAPMKLSKKGNLYCSKVCWA